MFGVKRQEWTNPCRSVSFASASLKGIIFGCVYLILYLDDNLAVDDENEIVKSCLGQKMPNCQINIDYWFRQSAAN